MPPKVKLADEIKEKLLRHVCVSGYDIAIPNFYFGRFEMDVFLLRPSGLVYEYEIKISKSDFKADFKKSFANYKEYHERDGETKKHDALAQGNGKCNRFFFVVPEDLISADECPKHAGLIYYHEGWFSVVKSAPLLTKKKQDVNYIEISKSLGFREQHWVKKYRHERWENKKNKEYIENLKAELNNPTLNK